MKQRFSGILLHITSLPGPYGIGEIGPAARAFADWLGEAGQRAWQVLPLGPTGYGDSPYQSFSAFAGNPLLISFEDLLDEGLLTAGDLEDFPEFPAERVEYGPVIEARAVVFERLCAGFEERARGAVRRAFSRFCHANRAWLEDYALFMILKARHGGAAWPEWAPEFQLRDAVALERVRAEAKSELQQHRILQFVFHRQWARLRKHCRARKIQLIGDLPIFAAPDSADVWSHPELFLLDAAHQPTVVAGVPPDYFSATGQRWGNPLYDWAAHQRTKYAWWMARLEKMLEWTDRVRIDHFRGFESYWEIPASEPTAVRGRWTPGPGAEFFHALEKRFGRPLPFIAENLGVITDAVESLREAFQLPGMTVLQFRFGAEDMARPGYEPCGEDPLNVIYTGTHDNDTTVGWLRHPFGPDAEPESERVFRERVLEFLDTDLDSACRALKAYALDASAQGCLLPLQDVLELGSEARMNRPGTAQGNWSWRFSAGSLDSAHAADLREMTQRAGR